MDRKIILVTGDQSPDYDIYLHSNEDNPRPDSPPTIVRASYGGAGMAGRFLKAAADAEGNEDTPLNISFLPYSQVPPKYVTALWQPSAPGRLFKDDPESKRMVWRTKRSLSLGEVRYSGQLPSPDQTGLSLPSGTNLSANVLFLEDDGAGFRFHPQIEITALLGRRPTELPEWIVFKTCAPVCYGEIWRTLSGSQVLADRLIVVVPVNDLRLSSAIRVSHGISWERTSEDLARELRDSPELAGLRRARHVVVTLYGEGALWMERTADPNRPFKFRLFFDPANMETEWSRMIEVEGEAYGFHCCFAASVTAHCARWSGTETAETWLNMGIRCGLKAMRVLRVLGHGFTANPDPDLPLRVLGQLLSAKDPDRFEATVPANVDWRKFGPIGMTDVSLDRSADQAWRILEATDPWMHGEPLYGMARRVALIGTSALENIPYSRFKKIFTADRDEIEELRNLKLLIQAYDKDKKEVKPLSLAVFGPPGAGKSFGVKQIASDVLGEKVPCLEFNLSQFNGPEDLIGAFHQVRDKALEGHVPVVFWDEFDSASYKWLQYLLAPMQDGKFQEGQITHPIGRCVFVFAGATSYTCKDFGPAESVGPEARREFVLRKGPDFISRLHGSMDVLGPNPRQLRIDSTWKDDSKDVCFPVRRAILLRSLLGLMDEQQSGHRLDMDHGLLVALLEIGHFKYGSRSFEKVALSLKQDSRRGYKCSNLPTNESLEIAFQEDLSVFMNLLNEFHNFQACADKLAPTIHEFYRDLCRANGWTITYDVPYNELPEAVKQDNIAAARRIPWILGLVGLTLVEGSGWSDEEMKVVSKAIASHLEFLASEEHELWMQEKRKEGWYYGKQRNDEKMEHDCLLPFDKLEEKQKAKDRDAVTNYPEIAKKAGFKIVVRKRHSKD